MHRVHRVLQLDHIPRLVKFVSARLLSNSIFHIEFFNQRYVLYMGFFVNCTNFPGILSWLLFMKWVCLQSKLYSPSGNIRECTTFSNFPFDFSSFELNAQTRVTSNRSLVLSQDLFGVEGLLLTSIFIVASSNAVLNKLCSRTFNRVQVNVFFLFTPFSGIDSMNQWWHWRN